MSQNQKKLLNILVSYFISASPKNQKMIKELLKMNGNVSEKALQMFLLFRGNISIMLESKLKNVIPTAKYTDDQKKPVDDQSPKKSSYYALDMPKLIQDLKYNLTPNKTIKSPPFNPKLRAVTAEAINCLTTYNLISINTAESNHSRLKRLEELLEHLTNYPEAKQFAVKTGAIKTLLTVRGKTKDIATQDIVRCTLAALGYADPPRSSGIRILSIDGGGMRGIAVLNMLAKIEELTGKKIFDLFDYICGVSTGAIITCGLIPPHRMSMSRMVELYLELSRQVFNQNSILGTGKLVWSHAYYDTAVWEKFLKTYLGSMNLIDSNKDPLCPKIAVISTVFNRTKVSPFIFRNYGDPCYRSSEYNGSFKHTVFEAVRASAAAPTIFEGFKTGDMIHQDGGIVVNNPASIALHEARCLWPDEPINCLVSIGTGKYDPIEEYDDSVQETPKISTSWKQIFEQILQSATDTEGVHRMLNDLLPDKTYFRLNPHLTQTVSMDETNEKVLAALEEDTKMYCRRNEDKFFDIARKLVETRPYSSIVKDSIIKQLRVSGIIL